MIRRSHAEPAHHRRTSGSANGTLAEPIGSDPDSVRNSRRAVRLGLGLLLLALSVGLAAALFLTIGTAGADVLPVGANAAF